MSNASNKNWLEIRRAMQLGVRDWIYDRNVMFIDYGWREKEGTFKEDEEPRIRIHVIKKYPKNELQTAIQQGRTHRETPPEIGGIRVDTPQGLYNLNRGWGSPFDVSRRGRVSPMQGGISISDAYRYIAGTLGGLVTDRDTGDPMILSNWHVLAGRWYAQPGWPICQPGLLDGGQYIDLVARLSRHAMDANFDAAVAKLTGSRRLDNRQFNAGVVQGSGWAYVGMNVYKSGRTTNLTYGRVTGVEGVAKLPYNGVYRLIRNVMTIMPRTEDSPNISDGGDSGSFWIDGETANAVGLHFAGSNNPDRALAMDMPLVLDALNVDI